MGNNSSRASKNQYLFNELAACADQSFRIIDEKYVNNTFNKKSAFRLCAIDDIDHVYTFGNNRGTFLEMACASSQVDVINELLDLKCDVNKSSNDAAPLDIICKDLMFVTSIEDHTQYNSDAVGKVILRMVSMGAKTKQKGTILTLMCAPLLEDAGLVFIERHIFSTNREWWLQLIFLLCGTGHSEKIVEQLIHKIGIDDIDFRTIMGKNIVHGEEGWAFTVDDTIDDNYITLIDNVKANGWKTVLKLLTDIYRKIIVGSMENGYSGDVVNLMLEYFI